MTQTMSAAAVAVVAIDGPAGSGKTTLAARIAATLGIPWFSSGALYRGVSYMTESELADPVASACGIIWRLRGGTLEADGVDITAHLHSVEIDRLVPGLSALPQVRRQVNLILHRLVANGPAVVEGRDIGTEVFPAAAIKIYLDASPAERAQRRREQRQSEDGVQVDLGALDAIERRDRLDRSKSVGALRAAPDATIVDTSGLTVEEVCESLLAIVRLNAPRGVFSPAS